MPDGKAWTSCFIRMLPRDMAKIGQLYLNKGTWNGQRIVSEAWVSESTSDHIVSIPSMGMRYGYHWHIEKFGVFEDAEIFSFSARGNGGNELHIFPMLDLVVVFTSSGYNTLYSHFQPGEMLVKHILPTFSQMK
jgi:CubicO group peptidase (beta-lactamase class C family)